MRVTIKQFDSDNELVFDSWLVSAVEVTTEGSIVTIYKEGSGIQQFKNVAKINIEYETLEPHAI